MKLLLIIVLFITFASLCLGQTPTQLASPEKTKTFGSSLEKYKNKEQRSLQNKQKSNESDDGGAIRVKTDLVVNDVLVTDQNGKMITDLKKNDFIITEDSAPQKIEIFSSGENASVPRSIILIIENNSLESPYLTKSLFGNSEKVSGNG